MSGSATSELSVDTAVNGDEAPARGGVPWRGVIVVLAWFLAFGLTRLVPVALTLDPSLYGPDVSDPTGDLDRYAGWATETVGDGLMPYREVDIEYPPGSLPFVMLPALSGQFSRHIFIAIMVVLDAAAFGALLALARRSGAGEGERQRAGGWGSGGGEGERQRAGGRGSGRRGSYSGAATWLLLPPVLGVLMYARLDLLPAVALLFALERAHARGWFASGVWLGLGAAAKLVPALFLPLSLMAAAGRRLRLVGGALIAGLVAWLPFALDTGELIHDVLGYHGARGIHLESLWGSLLNLERIAGGPVDLEFQFGAYHIVGPRAEVMLRATTLLSLVIVAITALIAVLRWRRRPERARLELPLAVTATLALLLGTGRVFSPQFTIWLLAVAAVLFAVHPRIALWAGPLLLVIVVLTAAVYPLGFDLLREGARWPAFALVFRNVAVTAFGLLLTVRWLWGGRVDS
jgi:hypothetical protein